MPASSQHRYRFLKIILLLVLLGLAISLYSNWTADAAGRQHTFHDVCRGMLDVLETYFSMFVACFHSPQTADQCREACNVFITDLSSAVDEIIF